MKKNKLALTAITAVALGTAITVPITAYASEVGYEPTNQIMVENPIHARGLSGLMTWSTSGGRHTVTATPLNNSTQARATSNGLTGPWANQGFSSFASTPSRNTNTSGMGLRWR